MSLPANNIETLLHSLILSVGDDMSPEVEGTLEAIREAAIDYGFSVRSLKDIKQDF